VSVGVGVLALGIVVHLVGRRVVPASSSARETE
jgi:hypothetical protein